MISMMKGYIPRRYIPRVQKLYGQICAFPYYLGHQVYCPCCDHHFRRFVPSGRANVPGLHGPTQNSRCPRCHSFDRHRLQWLYLHNRTNIFCDRLRVLHFAPEAYLQKKLHDCSNLDYTSADIDSPLAMIKVDITDIPYEENTFDVILCSHVLEHIPDDRKAMSELYRILKPGGWALILVPFEADRTETFEDSSIVDPEERTRLFGQHDHVRVYGRDFTDRLECAGFTVRQEFYARELDPGMVQRCVLFAEVDMFYCVK
jgi:SAM-dependent methyltransferase